MSYYTNKEKLEGKTIADRPVTGPKHINDDMYGTIGGGEPIPPGEGEEKKPADGTDYKKYDGSKNSGGSHSSSIKPEN